MTRSTLALLRDFVPIRPLTREEAMRIAELQAARMRELLGLDDDALPTSAIADLPRIQVEYVNALPVSGATHWANGRWLILINSSEPETRQRFSLAHEFKHILDHRFIDVLYQHIPEQDRSAYIEYICNYFAGCLLMPRRALKRVWGEGIQRPRRLAAHFDVSEAAVTVRLNQTGLARPIRCSYSPTHHSPPWQPATGIYQRVAALAP